MATKVLHVIARMNTGGTASFLHTLLTHQSNPKYEHLLVTGAVQGAETEDSRLHELPVLKVPELGRRIDPKRDLIARAKLRKIISDYHPDLIITHTFKAGALVRTLRIKTPVVHTFHGHLLADPEFSGLAIRVIVRIERALAHRTTMMTTTGKSVQVGLEAAGIRHKHWRNIHPGVLPPLIIDQQRAFKNLGLELDHNRNLVIAWHSRFAPVKNVQLLFDISRAMPDYTFLVSGSGPLFEDFHLQHPENVHLLGWQKAEDVLGACDVLLSTSFNEGLPLSLIEASMLGKPCITTLVGSVEEIVIDGVTGFFVEPTVAAFSQKIDLLNRDRQLYSRLSKEASRYSRERFQVEFFIKQYEELIENSLELSKLK